LVISYVGYGDLLLSAKKIINKPCQKIELSNFSFEDDFIVVTDYLTEGIELHYNGAYTNLNNQAIDILPGQLEQDALTTLQFLPGISSPDGTVSNINIRGGTADQNLILWESIPIYHAAHHFGMISSFNPNIIDQVKVYRGGFDAQYGGRISGVIDMKSEENLDGNSNFGVGANLINGFTYGKLSFLNDKANIIYSLRHSYANLLQTPTVNNINKRIHQGVLFDVASSRDFPPDLKIDDSFDFFDSNIKASFRISDKDQLSIAWFYFDNNFDAILQKESNKLTQTDSLQLNSQGASLNYKHTWNTQWTTEVSAYITDYFYNYQYRFSDEMMMKQNKSGLKTSDLNERKILMHTSYRSPQNHTFKIGLQNIDYNASYKIEKKRNQNSERDEQEKATSNIPTIYTTFNSSNKKKWGLDAGLRVNYFQKEKRFFNEPRLRVWLSAREDLKIHFNAGRYHQFISQLVEIDGDQSNIETPVWILAGNREVPILTAHQWQGGILYEKKSWLIDLQVYQKNIKGVSSLATGFDEGFGRGFHIGDANIQGIDLLIKKRWKNYRTWISYTLSKVEHQFPSFFDRNFKADNDQPHSLYWVHLLNYRQFEFSLGWQLTSGNPYSLKENFNIHIIPNPSGPNNENIRPLVNEFNSERLPIRHRLDASIVYNLLPKEMSWKGTIGLSLFNIYDQANIYNRSFLTVHKFNEPPDIIYTDKGELRFTPNLVVKFEW